MLKEEEQYLITALKYLFTFSKDGRSEASDDEWLNFYHNEGDSSFDFVVNDPYFDHYSVNDVLGIAANISESFYSLGRHYDPSKD